MGIHAVSVGLVVHPVPLINITVYVRESSVAVRSVVFPVALVKGTVSPNLFAVAVAEATFPLAFIDGVGYLEAEWGSHFAAGHGVVDPIS